MKSKIFPTKTSQQTMKLFSGATMNNLSLDLKFSSLSTVRQLHREFLRAGADVMQTFTFYASDDKLQNRGNTAAEKIGVRTATGLSKCD